MRKKIQASGNSAAIVLSKDMLSLMGIEVGDEVEIRFMGKAMLVTPVEEVETQKKIDEAIDEVFTKRRGLLKRLASDDILNKLVAKRKSAYEKLARGPEPNTGKQRS